MPFQLSPGVLVTEKDLTNVIPAVATSTGAFAGAFLWGPVEEPVLITSEGELVARFGEPYANIAKYATATSATASAFFTAANFLAYSNSLYIARAGATAAENAHDYGGSTGVQIKNEDDYLDGLPAGATGSWVAKYPGSYGNSLKVSMIDSTFTGSTGLGAWTYGKYFDSDPGRSTYSANQGGGDDEIHVVVIDEDGKFTGTRDTILETFSGLSKAADAKKTDGTNNYWKDVINNNSKYIWSTGEPPEVTSANLTSWGAIVGSTGFATIATAADGATGNYTVSLSGGTDAVPTSTNLRTAFDLFNNTERYDIGLIPVGEVVPGDAKYVIENVAAGRKDCMAFASAGATSDGTRLTGSDNIVDNIVAYRTDSSFNVNSSYGVLDSGFKYQYDRYNDTYRWVPLNGDVAGLCARTDYTDDPWYSPGGLNRGQIKNVVKLSYNPNQSQRDTLYKNGINPVVSFPGQGTILYGDKTLLTKPSAFDRINVRRLFIVLEKAIATAAKYQLFEFNDDVTRTMFRSMVEPFLRDVQGRRGIYDFRVVCDETNNTGEVIDRNEFVADIYIKPARSINFITLNFIAVRTGVAFEEIGG